MKFIDSRPLDTLMPSLRASSAMGAAIPDSTLCSKVISLSNPETPKMSCVTRFAWATLCWILAVVLWGAYVRATGSGSGCGNKWPFCNGDVVGTNARAQTVVEFTHRMSSGVSLLMVACLAVWCWRATQKHDWARYSALAASALLVNEVLLGAALVLLNHVAHDQSGGRIFFLCLHLGNTLLLLATLSLTAVWLSNGGGSFALVGKWPRVSAIGLGLLATMFAGTTGTVAALADTLFPAITLRSSLAQDFSPDVPFLLHFRLVHPAVAGFAAGYVLWVIFRISTHRNRFSRYGIALMILLFVQVGIGMMNVLLLAPVWLQIAHLFAADVLWILLVLASADLVLERADLCPVRAPGKLGLGGLLS
jgi:cytochrome c oxidase assembly protein subunit 15